MKFKTFLFGLSLSASLAFADSNTETLHEVKPAQRGWAGLFGPKAAQFSYDTRMIRAAEIATARAHEKGQNLCWRYVKQALLAAKAVESYPSSPWAKSAAVELPQRYGFKRLDVKTPYEAPIGAVLVYGGNDAGHVEIRTEDGFVSDFVSKKAYPRPFIGAFVKPS